MQNEGTKPVRIVEGLLQIAESGSGVFALISLVACLYITLHVPGIGAAAFVALIPILNLAMIAAEHREEMKDKEKGANGN